MQEIKGDLIELARDGMFDLIGQGCNCFNTMGAGIARSIRSEFPQAYIADVNCANMPINKLGNYSVSGFDTEEGKPVRILNIYSQYNPGSDFRPDALRLALFRINKEFPNCHIGLPLIGCGIGGGNWEEVKQIIEEELVDLEVTVVHYDNTREE